MVRLRQIKKSSQEAPPQAPPTQAPANPDPMQLKTAVTELSAYLGPGVPQEKVTALATQILESRRHLHAYKDTGLAPEQIAELRAKVAGLEARLTEQEKTSSLQIGFLVQEKANLRMGFAENSEGVAISPDGISRVVVYADPITGACLQEAFPVIDLQGASIVNGVLQYQRNGGPAEYVLGKPKSPAETRLHAAYLGSVLAAQKRLIDMPTGLQEIISGQSTLNNVSAHRIAGRWLAGLLSSDNKDARKALKALVSDFYNTLRKSPEDAVDSAATLVTEAIVAYAGKRAAYDRITELLGLPLAYLTKFDTAIVEGSLLKAMRQSAKTHHISMEKIQKWYNKVVEPVATTHPVALVQAG